MSSTHLVILTDNPNPLKVAFLKGLLDSAPLNQNFQLDISLWPDAPSVCRPDSIIMNRVSGYDYKDDDLEVEAGLPGLSLTSPELAGHLRSKGAQQEYFKKKGLPTIPSWNIKGAPELEFPLVLKTERGEGGQGVELFTEKKTFAQRISQLRDNNYLVQPLILARKELRIYTFRGQLLWNLEKFARPGEWKHNLLSSQWSICPSAPPEALSRVLPLSKELGLCAWDFLQDINDKYHFLELNLRPGVKFLQQQGSDPFHRIIDCIRQVSR